VLTKVHDQQTRQKEVTKWKLPYKTTRRKPNFLESLPKEGKGTLRTEAIFNDRFSNSGTTTRNYSDSRKNKRFTY
jgi:hypothetical protein